MLLVGPHDATRCSCAAELTRAAGAYPLGVGSYVHCTAGINRANLAVLGYFTFVEGMPLDEALALIRTSRPQVIPSYQPEPPHLIHAGACALRFHSRVGSWLCVTAALLPLPNWLACDDALQPLKGIALSRAHGGGRSCLVLYCTSIRAAISQLGQIRLSGRRAASHKFPVHVPRPPSSQMPCW
jgi:hypothetical protein